MNPSYFKSSIEKQSKQNKNNIANKTMLLIFFFFFFFTESAFAQPGRLGEIMNLTEADYEKLNETNVRSMRELAATFEEHRLRVLEASEHRSLRATKVVAAEKESNATRSPTKNRDNQESVCKNGGWWLNANECRALIKTGCNLAWAGDEGCFRNDQRGRGCKSVNDCADYSCKSQCSKMGCIWSKETNDCSNPTQTPSPTLTPTTKSPVCRPTNEPTIPLPGNLCQGNKTNLDKIADAGKCDPNFWAEVGAKGCYKNRRHTVVCLCVTKVTGEVACIADDCSGKDEECLSDSDCGFDEVCARGSCEVCSMDRKWKNASQPLKTFCGKVTSFAGRCYWPTPDILEYKY